MAKRFPFRTAIAGLTALAVVAPVVAPANTTVLSAAVAQAQQQELSVTLEGPEVLAYQNSGEFARETFTATVPGATGGSVIFYLDNKEVTRANVDGSGKAQATFGPQSFGKHTVTARYAIQAGGTEYHPHIDGTKVVDTPFPQKIQLNGEGLDGTNGQTQDVDSYSNFGIVKGRVAAADIANVETRSTANPLVLQPGEEYTIRGRMIAREAADTRTNFGRYYEYGFNPPVDSTYIEGTAKKYNADGKGWDYNREIFSLGTESGVDQQTQKPDDGGSRLNPRYYPVWGQVHNGHNFPKINVGYVGLQTATKGGLTDTTDYRYSAPSAGYPYDLHASFVAPDIPGIHIPQYATYKYRNDLHVLEPMYAAAFKIEAPQLPERKQLDPAKVTLTAPANAFVGETVKLQVTSDTAGTVQLYDGTTKLGDPLTVTAGQTTSRDYRPGSAGTKNIKAVFTPSAGIAKRGSEATTNIDVKAPQATTLSLSAPANATAGNHTLTATVTEKVAGKVEFYNGTTKLGEGTVNTADGKATWSGDFAEGTHNLRAVFTPTDAAYKGSEATHTFTVGSAAKQNTTITITPSKNPAVAGEQVEVTIKVTDNVPGKVVLSDAKGQKREFSVVNGPVTTKYTPTAPGTINVSAEFIPSVDTHNGSSANLELKVNAAPVTLQLNADQKFETGKPGTLTTKVSPGNAEGTVTFSHNGRQLGDPVPVSRGIATLYNAVFNSTDNPTVDMVFTPAQGSVWAESTGKGDVTISQAPAQATKLTLTGDQGKKEGETVTLTATVDPKAAAGEVEFFLGTESLGTGKVDTATGQAQITGTRPAGTYNVRAVFTPDNPLVYKTSEASTTVNIGSATKTTPEVVVTAQPASAKAGTLVRLSATMNPQNVAGTVIFYEDGTRVGEANLLRGVGHVDYAPKSAGSKKITAEFIPDAATEAQYNRGYGETSLDVQGVATRVSASPVTLKTREKTTVTVNVAAAQQSDATTPVTGTVTFSENGVQIGEPQKVVAGKAPLELYGDKAGERDITATFTPADGTKWAPSTGTVKVTVQQAPAERTRTDLSASNSAPAAGEDITLTATVKADSTTENIEGSYDFYDGDTKLNTNPVDVDTITRQATFTTSFEAGSHKLRAVFTPTDKTRWTSSDDTKTVTVSGDASAKSSVELTVPDKAFTGEPVTIEAKASPSDLAGKIQFFHQGKQIGEKSVEAGGTATIEYAFPEAGTHQVSAKFIPSKTGAYGPSNEKKSRRITVKDRVAEESQLTLTPPRSAEINTDATITATVTPADATGTVTFYDGDTEIGSAKVDGGTATITHSFDELGEHPLRATFVSDNKARATDAEATSAYPLTVINPGESFGVTTSIALNAPASIAAGKLFPLDINVAPADAKGHVEIFDGDRSIGTVRVSMGRAKKPISLVAGSHTIRAVFTPEDERFSTAETSRTIIATGNGGKPIKSEPYMTLDAPQNVRANDTFTVTATLERDDLAGRIEFYNGNQILGASNVKKGKAEQEVRLPEGTHVLHAVFTPANGTVYSEANAAVTVNVGSPRPVDPVIYIDEPEDNADGSQTITFRSEVKAGTRGQIRFTLADGTVLGSAPIQADGKARLTHTFPQPGNYDVKAVVIGEDGNPAGPEVSFTLNANGQIVDGKGDSGSSSSNGSSLKKTREETDRAWKIAGIVSGVTLLFAGIVGLINHPNTKAFLAQFGIRY